MAKQTGWVIAATAGATIDGRVITEQWIKDMAEQYSTEEYTAMIWPEHFRSSWAPFEGKNWGTVDEVKAAKSGGKLRLYVKLTANDYLLEANKDGQKLFMSIEPNIDYKGTGKAYLTGIAVTDSPASTGTTRLKFSVGETLHEQEASQLEQLLFTDFINDTEQHNTATEKGLFAILQDFFTKSKKPEPATDTTEEEPMNKEQFDALMGKIGGIETKVAELETKFNQAPAGDKPAGGDTEKPEDKPADKPEESTGITAEQFNQLNDKLTAMADQVTELQQKFKDASTETQGQEPDKAGGGETVSVV